MGRRYSAIFSAVAVTAAQDLFEVLSATDSVTRVLGFRILQTTDVKDAEEEILRLETVRGIGSVTSGSGGGSNPTAQPAEDGDAAFGGTIEINNTTRMVAGSGTLETLEIPGWNVRIPLDFYFTPETAPVISPGNRWTLALPAAPADSLTMSGTIFLEEIGG